MIAPRRLQLTTALARSFLHSRDDSPLRAVLRVVDDVLRSFGVRAVRAAIEGVVRLDAVTEDLAAAVGTDRRQLVNRAFEAVEGVRDAGRHDLERHVVVVAAYLA